MAAAAFLAAWPDGPAAAQTIGSFIGCFDEFQALADTSFMYVIVD